MLADSPVLVLIAACAVKAREAVSVLREVSGNPVEDNADACLVSLVDEIHQILRLAVTGGSSEVACALIAPASVERELGERHELNVCIAHFLYIGNKLLGKLAVAVEVAVVIFAPRARVYLVNVDRTGLVGMSVLELVPCGVVPLVVIDMICAGSVVGTGLAVESVGVGLHYAVVPRSLYAVLVAAELPETLDKQLPDA